MIYTVKILDTNGVEITEIPKTVNWLQDLAQSGLILQTGCHNFKIISEDWMSKDEPVAEFCELHELEYQDAILDITGVSLSYESGKTLISYNCEETDYDDEIDN